MREVARLMVSFRGTYDDSMPGQGCDPFARRDREDRRGHGADSAEALAGADTVVCIAFIRPTGKIRDIRVINGDAGRPLARGRVLAELRRPWRLEAAHWQGQLVDSWIVVNVPVTHP